MSNKEKFKALVSKEKTNTVEKNRARIKSRAMLREAQGIALKVLDRLDELNWSQRDLAKRMEVSPQQITKIVSGKENLTLETQIKLQELLDIPILASYYEKKFEDMVSVIFSNREKYKVQKESLKKDEIDSTEMAAHFHLAYEETFNTYNYKEVG